MKNCSLIYDKFDPQEEKLREALTTLGNGYFCTRGAAPERDADEHHYPGTYLAGGYNRLVTEIEGRDIENEDLVNMPNWLSLTFRIENGSWFDLRQVTIHSFRQELNLQQGLLQRHIVFEAEQGRRCRLEERRLVHMGNRHLAALETVLTAENWSGTLEFRSALDGRVRNRNVERYRDLADQHLKPIDTRAVDDETLFLQMRTSQSRLEIALAARTRIWIADQSSSSAREVMQKEDYIAHLLPLSLEEGQNVRVAKTVALFTSRDEAISECGLEARNEIARAGDFATLLHTHKLSWAQNWQYYDIKFEGSDQENEGRDKMILRLHLFHLLQTVSLHTIKLDVGVPSRGWHGEGYRGHIFWDELFIFPLLNLRTPEITRTLLHYRYRRLPEARHAAQQSGYRGAMFPWQSGSNGREESQKVHLNPKSGNWIPDNSRLQRHVNAAIAWNTWQYFQATGDMEFLCFYGAEMILEIARFWASIATWNEECQRYEILGVMGPDEYHDAYPDSEQPGLDNNAYTNLMAVWVLVCAQDLLNNVLPPRRRDDLCKILNLGQDELTKWDQISHKMRLVFHDDGIISQFEGYDQLQEFDWQSYHKKHGKVMRLDRILEAEDDTPNRYKCSKQADVLMLFYLFSAEELRRLFDRLGYSFESDAIPQNIDYYLARTSHGSTLSQIVHSWVLSRSDREESWELFKMALRSDIDDVQGGTTPEGIHLGAMAGTVDLIQRGYTGIEMRDDILRLNPLLPREIGDLALRLRYRGQQLELQVTSEKMILTAFESNLEPIRIGYAQKEYTLVSGKSLTFNLETEWAE